jgi:hypothetical protein
MSSDGSFQLFLLEGNQYPDRDILLISYHIDFFMATKKTAACLYYRSGGPFPPFLFGPVYDTILNQRKIPLSVPDGGKEKASLNFSKQLPSTPIRAYQLAEIPESWLKQRN